MFAKVMSMVRVFVIILLQFNVELDLEVHIWMFLTTAQRRVFFFFSEEVGQLLQAHKLFKRHLVVKDEVDNLFAVLRSVNLVTILRNFQDTATDQTRIWALDVGSVVKKYPDNLDMTIMDCVTE